MHRDSQHMDGHEHGWTAHSTRTTTCMLSMLTQQTELEQKHSSNVCSWRAV
jgi:hypothetical protein